MANSLTATIAISVAWKFTKPTDLSETTDADKLALSQALASGTGTNQVNQHFADERTVAAGANDNIDLYGSLVNAFGETINFTAVKAVVIQNVGADDGSSGYSVQSGEDLLIGGASSVGNAWATPFNANPDSKLTLVSGGSFALTAPASGFSVTSGTGDILRVRNNGTKTIKYRIILEGVA